jgi:hypothetical protein
MRAHFSGLPMRAFALGICLWTACGHDDKAPIAAEMPPPEPRDAGTPMELDPVDANVPLPRRDSDAGMIPPGMPDPGLVGSCAADSNKIYSVTMSDTPFTSTPLAVDPINSRFVLPFIGMGSCLDTLNVVALSGAAVSGAPQTALTVDECSLVKAAATSALGDGWLVALIDNRMPPYDVWVEPFDTTFQSRGDAQRITQNSGVGSELTLSSARNGQRAMVAWNDEDPTAKQSLYVRAIDATGQPLADAERIDQSNTLRFRDVSLAPLGDDGAGLTYWRYSDDFTTSDLVFVALDATGKPQRDAWVLSTNAGSSASIALSVDAQGGAVVYSRAEGSGRQIWFQQIDDAGQPALLRSGSGQATALRIVNAPFKGIDVSLTKLSASFVLAYRALPAESQDQAQIRVYFLDRFGAVIGDSDLSYTSPTGGRTAAASANDGRVAIAWSELNASGKSEVKLARLPCVGE